ncbi:uncharacterized protein [Fopius arisanus]|uniref:Uncharacterized protein n=1 Tax=Fopius arisanus TaxID=64838 RepID=A0A9R1SYW6_9HYME|nr:PREDICTED: uncharacterized protein LOC105264469 [Fopius arisanus]
MEQFIFIDKETGESLFSSVDDDDTDLINKKIISSTNDAETGEPEVDVGGTSTKRRVPFQIPRKIKEELSSKENAKNKKQGLADPLPEGTSFAQTNPVFLFLPAIFYCRWFALGLTVFEVLFHRWTHYKNKSLRDSDVEFRSPFYGITSEFCALCQYETRMDKVGKMQQIRMHKFLKQCHYMKRAVT